MPETCPRCRGKDGAHYVGCLVGRLFERILGPGYPWDAEAVEQNRRAERVDVFHREFGHLTPEAMAELDAHAGPDEALITSAAAEDEEWAKKPAPAPKPAPIRQTQGSPWFDRFIDECLILGDPKRNPNVIDSKRPDKVATKDLNAAFELWAEKVGAPHGSRGLTGAVMRLGYRRVQIDLGGRNRPQVIIGVTLRPGWGEDPVEVEAEPAPEPERPHLNDRATQEIRELMAKAKEQRRPRTDYRYDGPRPGRELPKEYRKLIAPLLEIPGWRYAPGNVNGKGKPRIYNPHGQMYCLPNSPSDVKGLLACRTMLKTSLGAPL